MSNVLKKDRHEAHELFLMNARNLEIYTIEQYAKSIPRQYKKCIGECLIVLAQDIYTYLKQGYSESEHDKQIARDCYLTAYGKLHALVSQIEIAYELIHFEEDILDEWSAKISKEIDLLEDKIS